MRWQRRKKISECMFQQVTSAAVQALTICSALGLACWGPWHQTSCCPYQSTGTCPELVLQSVLHGRYLELNSQGPVLSVNVNVERFWQVGLRKHICFHVRRMDDCAPFWGRGTCFCAFMEAELKPDALAPCFNHWNTWRKEEVRDEDRCSR